MSHQPHCVRRETGASLLTIIGAGLTTRTCGSRQSVGVLAKTVARARAHRSNVAMVSFKSFCTFLRL